MARTETMSQWRLRARQVIAETLDRLPLGGTLSMARAALKAAYPFGPRTGHPYRMWCIEQRLALGIKATPRLSCKPRATPCGVRCPHCDPKRGAQRPAGGCLLCCRLVARFLALTNAEIETWDAMNAEAIKGDVAASAALTDWLIEHGLTEE